MNTVRTCLITVVLSLHVASEKITMENSSVQGTKYSVQLTVASTTWQVAFKEPLKNTVKCKGKACAGDDKSVNATIRLSSVFKSVSLLSAVDVVPVTIVTLFAY